MKTIQLIKITETVLYMKNGVVISENLSANQKLQHSIFGEFKTMKTEEVIERWYVKANKEIDKKFWDYMVDNKIEDSSNYFTVITD